VSTVLFRHTHTYWPVTVSVFLLMVTIVPSLPLDVNAVEQDQYAQQMLLDFFSHPEARVALSADLRQQQAALDEDPFAVDGIMPDDILPADPAASWRDSRSDDEDTPPDSDYSDREDDGGRREGGRGPRQPLPDDDYDSQDGEAEEVDVEELPQLEEKKGNHPYISPPRVRSTVSRAPPPPAAAVSRSRAAVQVHDDDDDDEDEDDVEEKASSVSFPDIPDIPSLRPAQAPTPQANGPSAAGAASDRDSLVERGLALMTVKILQDFVRARQVLSRVRTSLGAVVGELEDGSADRQLEAAETALKGSNTRWIIPQDTSVTTRLRSMLDELDQLQLDLVRATSGQKPATAATTSASAETTTPTVDGLATMVASASLNERVPLLPSALEHVQS
jgi:hypothetical protein